MCAYVQHKVASNLDVDDVALCSCHTTNCTVSLCSFFTSKTLMLQSVVLSKVCMLYWDSLVSDFVVYGLWKCVLRLLCVFWPWCLWYWQDLSAHTRCTPNQRLATMKKFVDSVNNNEEARQLLENWGLHLDTSALAVSPWSWHCLFVGPKFLHFKFTDKFAYPCLHCIYLMA